jgi:hypothetical protein
LLFVDRKKMKKLLLLSLIGLALSQLVFGHNGEEKLRDQLARLQHRLLVAQGLQDSMTQLKSLDKHFDGNRCCIDEVTGGISNMKKSEANLTKELERLEHERWRKRTIEGLQLRIEMTERKMQTAYKKDKKQEGDNLKAHVADLVKQLSKLLN